MRRIKPERKRRSTADTHDLRRWAVEQAIRWPQVGGHQGIIGGYPAPADADVVARAKKLENYVLGKIQ